MPPIPSYSRLPKNILKSLTLSNPLEEVTNQSSLPSSTSSNDKHFPNLALEYIKEYLQKAQ